MCYLCDKCGLTDVWKNGRHDVKIKDFGDLDKSDEEKRVWIPRFRCKQCGGDVGIGRMLLSEMIMVLEEMHDETAKWFLKFLRKMGRNFWLKKIMLQKPFSAYLSSFMII